MRRQCRWTCIPVVVAVVILCLTPAYLLLVKGTNYWGSGILHVKEEAPKKDIGTTRSVPPTGIRQEKTRINSTQQVSSEQSKSLDASPIAVCCMDLMNLDKDRALVMGHRRKSKGFLTIGIPFTPRSGGKSDLRKTLESLIQNTPSELLKSQVTIVIFTSALDVGFRQSAHAIVSSFPDHVQGSVLQLIEAPRSFYPNLSALGNSFLSGRVKMNLDNAFLLAYARDSSEFYLQLSYDLRAPPNYLQTIRNFIRQQGANYWVTLEFYPVGFAGKLFRGGGRDIQQLIHLLTEYSKEQSLGNLFVQFKNLNVQQRDILWRPPLFSQL
ncbi:alpha-1,3-mannosyl-glycoprotein 4-beta-N-acetylglucosaminyltransferase C-like [Patiria miniata]|uniref:MGAT4 conserved region domain-containing protein n=1 Tax=Patiria miniata TaxID=46514 RepID=A0A914B059_PATMI|nr:alpha-1,3-mannosyl-glycoprotein 4-beta-N-acetylglucosaminyltransferase C-like [Patiria miniata]XP_038068895.1 alpha-1,3-mannosyl-glycoprotein 4-beta-N-acetylglucosaminyltransferase C-like [Patiria miniata]XP_038068896.1 alpha-1,3-mannosyl-glycoprotein 4-beta-N-acetylglucosaminyltransferase C-like [Patiria miniata]